MTPRVGEFRNALIDFGLRRIIKRKTAEVGETLVRTALAEAKP